MPLICIGLYIISDTKSLSWVLSCFKWLGNYSLEIYLLHLFIYLSWHEIYPMNETQRYIITIIITLILCKPIHNLIVKLQQSQYYLLK